MNVALKAQPLELVVNPMCMNGDGFSEGPGISMENFVTFSGCSTRGKSTLLVELRQRGFATIEEPGRRILGSAHRYNKRVFLAPPWPEIYVSDEERRHGLSEAVAEYGRLVHTAMASRVMPAGLLTQSGNIRYWAMISISCPK